MRKYLILIFILVATSAIAGGPIDVDGVAVDGDVDAMPVSDIRAAITEYDHIHAKKLTALTVASKDVLHAYLDPRDLGWVTVERADIHEPDGSIRHGWSIHGQGLPEFKQALQCINAAQQVYIFRVETPDNPHRDDAHMRLLDGEARTQLIGTLGSDDAWENALDSLRSPPSPPDVGFVFKHGNDELVLFPYGWLKVAGTFDGEHLGGLLATGIPEKLKAWKAEYARPELGGEK